MPAGFANRARHRAVGPFNPTRSLLDPRHADHKDPPLGLSGLFAAGLLSIPFPVASESDAPRFFDASITRDGVVTTLGLDAEGALTLSGRAEQSHALARLLDELTPGARVEDGLVSSWKGKPRHPSGLALALAVREGDQLVYRIAIVRDSLSLEWAVTEPIVRTLGAPFRLVELKNIGSDSIELSLRRGTIPIRSIEKLAQRVEELVFADNCMGAGTIFRPGKSILVDVVHGTQIDLGSLL